MLEGLARVVARFMVVATIAGCAASSGKSAPPPTGAPPLSQPGASQPAASPAGNGVDLEALYAREVAPLAKKSIQFKKLSGEAETAGTPTFNDHDTSLEVTIPIGTQSPLQCFVYRNEVDAGGTVLLVTREAAKNVDIRAFKVTDVALVGDYPVVFLEAQYLAKTDDPGKSPTGDKGQALGELKSMFYQHPTSSMLCLHDELGYNESFRRITRALAVSLKIAGAEINPSKLMEVYIDKIQGHPAGFSRNVVLPGKNGNLTFLSRSTTFIPRSQRDLAIQDTASSEIWDADGRLIEGAYAASDGGELSLQIALKKVGPQEYTYKGKRSGKAISGKFKTKSKRGLATDKTTTALVATELLTGKSTELKLEEYHAGLDPEAPVDVSYKTESKEKRLIKMTLGQIEAHATTDDKGRMEKLEIPVGAVTLSQERVLLRGSP
jgi:hypothetical protein